MSAHVDPVVLSSSSGQERGDLLAHLAGCAECRSRAVDHDPTILFALLALAPVPEKTLEAVSVEVARATRRDRSSIARLADFPTWPRRVAVAAALTLAMLCGYSMLHDAPAPPGAPGSLSLARPRADVEVDSSRGVSQVIDLTVGETQLVMVYNGKLDL